MQPLVACVSVKLIEVSDPYACQFRGKSITFVDLLQLCFLTRILFFLKYF